jgi:hypothetical protein
MMATSDSYILNIHVLDNRAGGHRDRAIGNEVDVDGIGCRRSLR